MFSYEAVRKQIALAVVVVGLGACSNPLDDDQDDHLNAVAVEVMSLDGAQLARYASGAWTFPSGDALHLHPGDELAVRIFFVEADGERRQLPASGEEITLRVEVQDPQIVSYEDHGDHGDFIGLAEGETTATIQAFHGGHPDFETNPGLPIEVANDH